MPGLKRFRLVAVLVGTMFPASCLSAFAASFTEAAQAYDRSTYARVDAKASTAPSESCSSVTTLGQYLGGLSSDPTLKARAIYAWIIANIKYERLMQTTQVMQEAETVLERRSAVCEGYSRLFEALAEAAGLEAVTIIGDAKYGYGETRCKHAWNAVRIDGRWRLLDCTWGCGYLDPTGQMVQGAPDLYFLTQPEVMIEGHFPDDPQWQLIDPPISREEFDRRVYLSATYYALGLSDIDQRYQIIAAEGSVRVSVVVPDGICISGVLYDSVRELSYRTFAQREGDRVVILARCPSPGRHTLRLLAWQAEDPRRMTRNLMDYTVIATGAETAGFPTLWPDLQRHAAHLDTPKTRMIPAAEEVFFDIRVPEATEVGIALVDEDELQPLTQDGTRFFGTATLSRPGFAGIWALFPDSTQHLALVTYEVVEEVPPGESAPADAVVAASPVGRQEMVAPATPQQSGTPALARQPVRLSDLVAYQPDSVVSRTLIDGRAASVSMVSLDGGATLDGRIAPGTMLIQVIDGEGEVETGGSDCVIRAGEALIVPALQRYTVRARTPLKIMSVTIQGGP